MNSPLTHTSPSTVSIKLRVAHIHSGMANVNLGASKWNANYRIWTQKWPMLTLKQNIGISSGIFEPPTTHISFSLPQVNPKWSLKITRWFCKPFRIENKNDLRFKWNPKSPYLNLVQLVWTPEWTIWTPEWPIWTRKWPFLASMWPTWAL